MIKKTLKINGVERILILDKDETLAQVLRDHLLLTGCKIGCGEGHCGACNVIMNGKVTRSCTTAEITLFVKPVSYLLTGRTWIIVQKHFC